MYNENTTSLPYTNAYILNASKRSNEDYVFIFTRLSKIVCKMYGPACNCLQQTASAVRRKYSSGELGKSFSAEPRYSARARETNGGDVGKRARSASGDFVRSSPTPVSNTVHVHADDVVNRDRRAHSHHRGLGTRVNE